MKTVVYMQETFELPEWANYIAADLDGNVWAYEAAPKWDGDTWWAYQQTMRLFVGKAKLIPELKSV